MDRKLTPTQLEVLKQAAQRQDGNLHPLPPSVRGAARNAVIQGLLARKLATKCYFAGHVQFHVTEAGMTVARASVVDGGQLCPASTPSAG